MFDTTPAAPNPFNAGFGVAPPYVAGRGALVHRVLANLQDGPGQATYLQVLLGGRGVGKTVLLNELRDRVTSEFGWTTVRWTAGPDVSLVAALSDAFGDTVKALRGRVPRAARGSAGVNVGVARAELGFDVESERPATVAGLLRRLGQIALAANRHVVLLVDELQAGESASLRALSAGLQETNGERLPVGLVAAGLPTTPARLRSVKQVTFLERQRTIQVGNLTLADARDALETPISASGRGYDPAIFALMLEVSGGYPYGIQLVGEATWEAAGAEPTITVDHAKRGASAARGELDGLYAGRWAQLGEVQRRYLIAVVSLLGPDGSASSGAVAASLGRETPAVSWVRDSLIKDHQLLYADAKDSLRVALPGLDDWLHRGFGVPDRPIERRRRPRPELSP